MRLTCRDLSAGLRPTGIRVVFTAATGGSKHDMHKLECSWGGLVFFHTSHYRPTSHCTQGASWSEPLYAHGKHKNAAAPLGTEGSFGNWNKLGFAVSLASGLTFVSTMLKEHSVSASLKPKCLFVSVDKSSKSLPDESSRL